MAADNSGFGLEHQTPSGNTRFAPPSKNTLPEMPVQTTTDMKIAFIIEQLNPFSSSRAPIEMALRLNRKHDITLYAHSHHANLKCQNMLNQAGIKVILIHPFPIPLVNKGLSGISLYLSLIKHKRVSDI